MHTAEPLRNRAKIEKMKTWLLEESAANPQLRESRCFLFVFRINTGLGISDILELRAGTHAAVREQKTGKERRHFISDSLQKKRSPHTLLSRKQAYDILSKAAVFAGVISRVGTHTLRKPFGYWHYQQFRDVAALQQILSHASPSMTLRKFYLSTLRTGS